MINFMCFFSVFFSRFFGSATQVLGGFEVNTGTHRTEASHTAQAQSLVIPESCNEALVCVEALSDILMLATSAGSQQRSAEPSRPQSARLGCVRPKLAWRQLQAA